MSDKLKNILSHTECPSTDHFYNYIENKLSKSETHAFESHLNDCEFCQEALDGFQTVDKAFVLSAVNEINTKVDNKVNPKFSIQYIVAAATIVLGLFFGSIYMLQDATTQSEELSVVPTEEKDLNNDDLAPIQITESEENKLEDYKEELAEEKNVTRTAQVSPPPTLPKMEEIAVMVVADEEEMIEEDVSFADESGSTIEYEAAEVESEIVGGAAEVLQEIPATAPVRTSTNSIEADNIYTNESQKDKEDKYNTIDFEHLLSFANEQINTSFRSETESTSTTTKKAKTYADYSSNNEMNVNNNNRVEIQKQLKQVQDEQYQKALDEMNFQITKDVWETEESATLNWLRSICQLKLGLSAEETLKNLKRNKNPYQEEAKKLYNQLY